MCDRLQGCQKSDGTRGQADFGGEKFYMTDKASHMCRWKFTDKAYSLHESDYKEPPVILIRKV